MKDTAQAEAPVNETVVDEPIIDDPVVDEPVSSEEGPYEAPRMWQLWRDRWVAYYPSHSHAIVYGLIGVVAAVLMLIIGFWPVLLIALLAFIGVALGQWQDGDPRIILLLVRMFRRRS